MEITDKSVNTNSNILDFENLTEAKAEYPTIKVGQTLECRSACDYDTIYTAEILSISKSGKTATYSCNLGGNKIRVSKIHNFDGHEYLRPENYSMAPTFRA